MIRLECSSIAVTELTLRLRLLGRALGTVVSLLDVEVGRGRSEENLQWHRVGAHLDRGRVDRAARGHIAELNLVTRLDGRWDHLAGAASTALATAVASAHGTGATLRGTSISAARSSATGRGATTVAALGATARAIGGDSHHESRDKEELEAS